MSRLIKKSKKSVLLLALAMTAAIFAACAQTKQSEVELGKAAYSARDYETAVRHYTAAAEQGDEDSQFMLGSVYSSGDIPGLEKDEAEADKWFRKAIGPIRAAAEEGQPDAQYMLGMACLEGLGGEKKDLEKAKEWFLKAAKQGDTRAQVLLQYSPEFVNSKE